MKPVLIIISALVALTVAGLSQETVFRTETRLVEVYATVKDQHGRYINGLTRDQFQLFDEGMQQPIVAFQAETSAVACALLLDTTGSMQGALPAVKNAVAAFVDALRPEDSAAVYSFSTSLNLLQDFTHDHAEVRRALLRARASGQTALFDAIAQVTHEISARQGKKIVVVFTDGADNASVLRASSAITQARKTGIPLYTVAEGDALKSRELLQQVRILAEQAGGQTYEARKTREIAAIFEDILANVEHSYLLAYKAPTASGSGWRSIKLSLTGVKQYRVHAREGYADE